MKLFFRKYGEGKPIVILHGLFGLSDNWQSFAKQLEQNNFSVYAVDLRNHGSSPHHKEFNYNVLATDVFELLEAEQIENPILMGHSLGGKTAMRFALNYPEKISSLIVVDIAPRYYTPHHQQILEGLSTVDVNLIKSRGEAEKILSEKIPEPGTRQFLLKNLYWKNKERLDWKFSLRFIADGIENVGEEITSGKTFDKPTLFIAGEKSKYINASDAVDITKLFPQSELTIAPNAGHWVHADNPVWLLNKVLEFTND
ncbi:MAG TPA: alpha/beta fold hydrolase [Bacteroidia bacterium]|nr:alpha/beta fold hydrolase [Bacteroidia bacterium]HNU32368.1 alpha/beta fold hydrolase [Bacteroidia bacterium]